MSQITYQNRYGTLVLEPVMEYRSVRGIRSDIVPDVDGCRFDIEVAEKIALITDNRRIQIAFQMPLTHDSFGYVLHHDSPSTAAICKIVSIDYIGGDSTMEIQSNRSTAVL